MNTELGDSGAFPYPGFTGPNGVTNWPSPGMTYRHWLIGLALMGAVGSSRFAEADWFATRAIEAADAVLAAIDAERIAGWPQMAQDAHRVGATVQRLGDPKHWRATAGATTFDFWPSTGRWRIVPDGETEDRTDLFAVAVRQCVGAAAPKGPGEA